MCVAWEDDGIVQGVVRLRGKGRPFSLLPRDVVWVVCCRADFAAARDEARRRPGAFTLGFGQEEYRFLLPNPYPWQQTVLEILQGPVDPRAIYWVWESRGNSGKTSLLKHICSCLPELRAIVVSGRPADVTYAICEHQRRLGCLPGCILLNLPRSFDGSFLSYPALEAVKDMLFFSPKYSSCMINGDPPHVMVFANEPPETRKLSKDRWRVREIRNLEIVGAAAITDAAPPAPRQRRRASSSSDSE